MKRFLPVVFVPLLLTGCASVTRFETTNLTPLQQSRTTNNLYTVEVSMASRQETLRWSTVQPKIVVDHQIYPMHPTLLMTNRWEGSIPVPPGTTSIKYHYKVDFDYNTFGQPKPATAFSPEYTLRITE